MQKKVLLIHPGTQHSYQLAQQLYKQNLLSRFCTGLAFESGEVAHRWIPRAFQRKLESRVIPGVPSVYLYRQPFTEFAALWQLKRGRAPEDVFFERNRRFQQQVPTNLLAEAGAVIGFDTSSWVLAERCKQMKIPFVLDVSIGHPLEKERVFAYIKKSYPAWSTQLQAKKQDHIQLEQQEQLLADKMVVPSSFVKRTYEAHGIPSEKMVVNPFGTDLSTFYPILKSDTQKKVTFLFFGSLSARKGLPLLLSAWSKIDTQHAELLIAGFGELPNGYQLPEGVTNLGPIAKDQRNALFARADVFVFPSFFEGLAQVQIEAAACGLPIIGTTNSGAEDLVEHGVTGFVIEAGNEASLISYMNFFLEHRDRISGMGLLARKKAEEFTWDAYGARWRDLLTHLLIQPNI